MTCRGPIVAAIAVALGAGATVTSAADWPQWRGPGRNGLVDRSPPLTNSPASETPVWLSEPIASGDRGGRGSLVVHAGRVYGLTGIAAGADQSDVLFCLDAASGKTIWKTQLREPAGSETASATPCLSDGKLYVVGSGSTLYCLRADAGSHVWEAKLPRKDNKPIASSVAVVSGVAVLLADVLTGVDARTGNVLWTQDKISGFESSPARWDAAERSYVVCNSRFETHCVDPSRGEIVWSVPGGGKSTPVVAQEYGGDFLVNMSDGRKNGLSAYRLTPAGPQKLWSLPAFDRGASPVAFDGHVYAIAGGGNGHGARMLCVHLDTGKVAWDETIDFAEVSSPVVADGKLFAVCGTFLWLVQATPERYGVLSRTDCRITLCTSPAVADGRLYLRQANAVACYDLRSAP
jgi:outer membrane protein assembly factor BamB